MYHDFIKMVVLKSCVNITLQENHEIETNFKDKK